MKRLAFLTKLLVLVSLILASLPSGATETVCVVGAKKRVVAMRKCGMPCCAHKSALVRKKAACCKSQATPRREACGIAGMSCHCETRYVATSMPAQAAVVKFAFAEVQPGIIGATPALVRVSDPRIVGESTVFGSDGDPPRKVPRGPMRGRAPPVTD